MQESEKYKMFKWWLFLCEACMTGSVLLTLMCNERLNIILGANLWR